MEEANLIHDTRKNPRPSAPGNKTTQFTNRRRMYVNVTLGYIGTGSSIATGRTIGQRQKNIRFTTGENRVAIVPGNGPFKTDDTD